MVDLAERNIVDAYMAYVVEGTLEFSGDEFNTVADRGWSNVAVVDVPEDSYEFRELLLGV